LTGLKSLGLWCRRASGFCVVLLSLAGCGGGGGGGNGGQQPPPGPPGTSSKAKELHITIDSVAIASPPVVRFTVTNENGLGFTGLADGDLRFNIAKLIPGIPTQWQDYIVRASGGAVQGSQERLRSGYPWGKLGKNGDGTYTYTFATDITKAPCPAPCTDAGGDALNLSYQPGQTHRVSIQQGNSALPMANAVYDFVPAGGAVTVSRAIVKTANCNACHDKIIAHGSRFEMKLCVTCHNPGSWIKNADNTTTTVDFKVMIHRIHRSPEINGERLPHNDYAVGDHNFADVVFPQDTRNCTKCHDGGDPETPQGNNWQDVPSMEACGSCHDDIDFSKDGSIDLSTGLPHEPGGHSGGVVAGNSQCNVCHREGGPAGTVAKSHTIPGKAERAFFRFNILTICGIPVDQDPMCAEGTSPTVTFSVEDPSGNGGHEYGDFYNIQAGTADPEYDTAAGSVARLTMDFAWKGVGENDYTNDANPGDAFGERPSRALQVNLLTSPGVSYQGSGVYIYKAASDSTPWTIPVLTAPHTPIGTVAVAIEGRSAAYSAADCGKVPPANLTGCYKTRVPVKAPVAYFAVNDTSPQPRRQVVDAATKCDRCHDVLNAHGSNRNDNGQLCVFCHNPNMTDVNERPKGGNGLPDASQTEDNKTEESVDFKRMIHGIHAASVSSATPGIREKGLNIGGGTQNDYSDLRFPGALSKCDSCHLEAGDLNGAAGYDTYVLENHSAAGGANWELPGVNGIFGSTVHSYPSADPSAVDFISGTTFADALLNQADDYKYSPIASVCSSCHDGEPVRLHMQDQGAAILGGPGSQQAVQEEHIEICALCHGPGQYADVKKKHEEATAKALGEFFP
jgi:OmcA/MtrC family decaheme c-type cytochrome